MGINENERQPHLAILALCCVSAHCSAWFITTWVYVETICVRNRIFEFEWANWAEADVETRDTRFFSAFFGFASANGRWCGTTWQLFIGLSWSSVVAISQSMINDQNTDLVGEVIVLIKSKQLECDRFRNKNCVINADAASVCARVRSQANQVYAAKVEVYEGATMINW